MKNILLVIVSILIACIPSIILYLKERKARLRSERALTVVREMGEIDDRIFRIRLDSFEDWPTSSEAQMLIVRRIKLHEEYSAFLGYQPLRDCNYMNELMRSVISTK
jgi:hypothetical protein